MAKLSLNDITSRYGATDALNDNFAAIETALENTLSRDGTLPNEMEGNLDMNGNEVLNAGAIRTQQLFLNGAAVSSSTSFSLAGHSTFTFTATAGQTSFSVSPSTIASTSLLLAFVNGVKLKNSEVSFLTSTITTPAMEAGDEMEFVVVRVA